MSIMKKIYINARFLTQPLTGVQRFSLELCKELNILRNDLVFLVNDKKQIINSDLVKDFNIVEINNGKGHYWEQIALPKYLKNLGSPLLINLCSTAPIFYQNQIVTHHDVTYVRYPTSFSFKFRLFYNLLIPAMLRSSKQVVTVSNFSKKEISDVYSISPHKINVIYNAVSDSFTSDENIKREHFCLAVSSPNLHKNFQRMIEAFLASNTDLHLLIIGGQATTFSNINYKEDPRVKFLGRIDDAELIRLYQKASFFIFPSLYEGFGIPPLEAQACGCPVIASNAASIPEVLGNSVEYFDPMNVQEIKSLIEEMTHNENLKSKLSVLGFENVKRFSWKNSASRLNDLINKVV